MGVALSFGCLPKKSEESSAPTCEQHPLGPNLGYVAKRSPILEQWAVAWRLEFGHFGPDTPGKQPALGLALGGDQSTGPLVVFETMPSRLGKAPGWTRRPSSYSQIHFADVDPRYPGPELLASSYAGLGTHGSLEVWPADDRIQSPLTLGIDPTMDFEIADVEGDGRLELAIAVKQAVPRQATPKKNKIGHAAAREAPHHEPGIRLLRLGVDSSSVPTIETLGFLWAVNRAKPRADIEVLNPRFFDVDGDGELELLYEATWHSLVVAHWNQTVQTIATSLGDRLAPKCDGKQAGSIWCEAIDGGAFDIDIAVIADETMVVTANDCHASHGGGDCEGSLQIYKFARGQPGERSAPTRQCIRYEGPGTLSALELVEGRDGGLLAIVGYFEQKPGTKKLSGGGLWAYDFDAETWSELVSGGGPRMPLDIEAVPGTGTPTPDSVVGHGVRATLSGPGPHRVKAVCRSDADAQSCAETGGSLLSCSATVTRECWTHEPRSNSVLLRSDAPEPGPWRVEFERQQAANLAVADAEPESGSGLWFLYPPNPN